MIQSCFVTAGRGSSRGDKELHGDAFAARRTLSGLFVVVVYLLSAGTKPERRVTTRHAAAPLDKTEDLIW